MLVAARERLERRALLDRVSLVRASMDRLPLSDACADFVVAHGIWNLAQSGAEFRRAVAEARRVARRGATLFVFTFSRATLPDTVTPLPNETFVFTEFSGQPQCFLTAGELRHELRGAGFAPDPRLPLTELNPRPPGSLVQGGGPVFLEGAFLAI
jgi:ubiquinone/menaquinone biosynthesis C-methylase UbiE